MSNTVAYPKQSEVLKELLRINAEKKQNIQNDYDNVLKEVDEYQTLEEMSQSAHPKKFNILDSYFEEGGVVEDSFEMQEKAIDNVNKVTNVLVYKKAECFESLTKELFAIAEEMDIRQENDLAAFADTLIERVTKQAALPLAPIAIGLGLASLVGGYFLIDNHTIDYGFIGNLEALRDKLQEFRTVLGSEIPSQKQYDEFIYNLSIIGKHVEEYQEKSLSLIEQIQSLTQNNAHLLIKQFPLDVEKSKQNTFDTIDKFNNPEPQQDTKHFTPQLNESVEKQLAGSKINDEKLKKAQELTVNLNKITDIYTNYLQNQVLPYMNSNKTYLANVFQNVGQIDKDERSNPSFWEKTKSYVGGLLSTDHEKQILELLDNCIKSIKSEINIKKIEKEKSVELNKPKLNVDFNV